MIHELRNNRTLLIEPHLFESKCRALDAATNEVKAVTDIYGNALPAPETIEGVSIVPIYGVIANRIPEIYKAFGYCDCDEISEWIDAAIEDSSVKQIAIDVDSPGGTVSGVMELAKKVANSGKQVDVFTAGMCCSAAYWIASGARSITATPSAHVGSIGCYTTFTDLSLMAKMAGIAVEVFRSSKFKGAGVPGTSLSDEQKQLIQAEVDAIASAFKADVKHSRPHMTEELMQGQSFMGLVAAENGAVDALADSFAEFFNAIKIKG